MWNAFNSLKYSGNGSTNVRKEDIERVLKEYDEQDDIIVIIYNIIEARRKKELTDESKLVKKETVEAISNIYNDLLVQFCNLKERFRVFCTADKYDDILMWGYYGNGGEGVCCKYDSKDIINSILTQRKAGIFVYGNVKYQDNKPRYDYIMTDLADNVFEYVMKCVFTKYSGWKHENEFRYVLLENKFKEDYIVIKSQVKEYYLGCKVGNGSLTRQYLNQKAGTIKELKKMSNKYKLFG